LVGGKETRKAWPGKSPIDLNAQGPDRGSEGGPPGWSKVGGGEINRGTKERWGLGGGKRGKEGWGNSELFGGKRI